LSHSGSVQFESPLPGHEVYSEVWSRPVPLPVVEHLRPLSLSWRAGLRGVSPFLEGQTDFEKVQGCFCKMIDAQPISPFTCPIRCPGVRW
jgi:hypothetical protein